MAEGGQSGDKLMSKTPYAYSEFVYNFYCQLCAEDYRHIEAEGFCVDCREYLCVECYSSHQKTRQTRHHRLLNKDNMPKDTPLSLDQVSKDISSKCSVHTGNSIEYYCKIHNYLGCSTCFMTNHRNCAEFDSVVEESKSILNSKEYTDFIRMLKYMEQKSRDLIAKPRINIAQMNDCHAEVIRAVKRFKEKIIETLDSLERDVIAESEKSVTESEQKMTSISENCSRTKEEIDTIIAKFQRLRSSKRMYQMYISMKENRERIKTLQDKLGCEEEALIFKKTRFESNRKFEDFMERPFAMGRISCGIEEITYLTSIDVISKADPCSSALITGSAVLSKNGLLVVDSSNSKVKLLNTQTNKLKHVENVMLWDVTTTSRNQAAGTDKHRSQVVLLRVSSSLSIERKIRVDWVSTGVAFSKNKLIVTYEVPPKIEIMNMYGKVRKRIETDCDGNKLFRCPEYVCVCKDGVNMYISDSGRNKVVSLTMDGVVRSVYSDSELKYPQKMCVDHHGHVYVCGRNSKNVHMLTANLTKIQIILTRTDGVESGIICVSHCEETNRLYVGMVNKVKVFQLS